MEKQPRKVQSEISRIFDEYYAKLDEINRKVDETFLQPVDAELSSAIDENFKKLADIIVKKHQESEETPVAAEEQYSEQATEIITELEIRVERARALINECEQELRSKYCALDKVIAEAQEKLLCSGLGSRKYIYLN